MAVPKKESSSKAWEQVGDRIGSLGADLQRHFEKLEAGAAADRVAFDESMRSLMKTLDNGFASAAKIVSDPALRRDVSNVAAALREAIAKMLADSRTATAATISVAKKSVAKRAPVKRSAAKKAPAKKAPAKKATAKRTPAKKATAKKATAKKATAKKTTA